MNNPEKYISLQEAAEYCSYSQEYLSLRARQGKLKSVKFGRNWVTKKEWVEEYLKKAEEYNNNFKTKKIAAPPENLPVEPSAQHADLPRTPMYRWGGLRGLQRGFTLKIIGSIKHCQPAVRFGFLAALVFVLLTAGIIFALRQAQGNPEFVEWIGKDSFVNVADDIKNYGGRISINLKEGAVISAGDFFSTISDNLKEFSWWMIKGYLAANDFVEQKLGEIADQTFAVGEETKKVPQKIVKNYLAANDFVERKLKGFARQTILSVPDLVRSVISNGVRNYIVANDFVEKGIVLGVQNLKEGYWSANDFVDPVRNFISQGIEKIKIGVEENIESIKLGVYVISNGVERKISNATRTALDVYLAVNNTVEEKIVEAINVTRKELVTFKLGGLVDKYFAANDFVEEKIVEGWQNTKGGTQVFFTIVKNTWESGLERLGGVTEIVTRPFRSKTTIVEKLPPEAEKNIIELQGKVKELEEKMPKEVVKEVEVSRITKIEPIKEITKETIVTRIDEAELAKLKTQTAQLSLWGTDIETLRAITKKLQAFPTYTPAPTAPIYIGYQGIQVGGTGTFNSLGVSGSAGITNLGVGESATFGSDSSDTLTVNANSYFKNLVTFGTNALTIDNSGNLTTIGNIKIVDSDGAAKVVLDNSGNLTLSGNQTTFGQGIFQTATLPQLAIKYDENNKLEIAVSSAGVVTFDASSGKIQAATDNVFYTEGGHPIRKKGEEIFRVATPIYRWGMPAQTNSTDFVRVSKYIASLSALSLPAALEGTTRVYHLIINYADDIAAASSSSWRIRQPVAESDADTFTLPGQNAATLEEGKPYLTGLLTVPDTDWQIEVKVSTGKTIRIFQIYLVAYDKVQ